MVVLGVVGVRPDCGVAGLASKPTRCLGVIATFLPGASRWRGVVGMSSWFLEGDFSSFAIFAGGEFSRLSSSSSSTYFGLLIRCLFGLDEMKGFSSSSLTMTKLSRVVRRFALADLVVVAVEAEVGVRSCSQARRERFPRTAIATADNEAGEATIQRYQEMMEGASAEKKIRGRNGMSNAEVELGG